MKFSEIPDYIPELEFDGDETDLRLHYQETFRWAHLDQSQYENTEKLLDDFSIKRHNYTVYMWYDVSGFDYWINNMREHNYINISVIFENTNFDKNNLEDLENDLIQAYDYAETLNNIIEDLY